LNINGPGANVLTVSGNNSSRVFQVTNAAFVIISGLTIAQGFTSGGGTGGGGSGSGSGGGIYNGLNLALTNCTLVNNIAGGSLFDFGGAIHDNGTTTTLRNC
jgi:hypothetical protein